VRMCKRERPLTNDLAVQPLLRHGSITGGGGGSTSGEVVRGGVGDGDGAGDRRGAMGFFPCAFRCGLEAFCCVCVERAAAKPSGPCDSGPDRNSRLRTDWQANLQRWLRSACRADCALLQLVSWWCGTVCGCCGDGADSGCNHGQAFVYYLARLSGTHPVHPCSILIRFITFHGCTPPSPPSLSRHNDITNPHIQTTQAVQSATL
jgi:hypothetical protein